MCLGPEKGKGAEVSSLEKLLCTFFRSGTVEFFFSLEILRVLR